MNFLKKNSGSFRDPAGQVYYYNNRIIRIIREEGKERFNHIIKNNLIKESVEKNFLIQSNQIENNFEKSKLFENCFFVEHEKIDFISYPYEWSFNQLKSAAIHHLDFQIFLLKKNSILIDASAYNIQFKNNKPIFIDLLSIDKYKEGDYWNGYNQFLEQFLNPLLLQSKKGISFNNWYKGNLNGIKSHDLNSVFSLKDKISLNVYLHVVLLSKISNQTTVNPDQALKDFNKKKKLSKKSYEAILLQLKKWILSLKPKKINSIWENYSSDNSYEKEQKIKKLNILKDFISRHRPKKLIDLGCNNGFYSIESLKSGCERVVGVDFDLNAINEAYEKSKFLNKTFLPLFIDFMNPSTNAGWNENERLSFLERSDFDCLIAFAFEHHLSLANNVPLEQVIDWMLRISKKGLIEFVTKNDPTVKKMLTVKGDIFLDYTKKKFEILLKERSKIVKIDEISDTRIVYEFESI